MRVVTLNIRHGADSHEKIRLEEIGEALFPASADVICMQEVDINVKRSGGVNQAEILGTLTHRIAYFSPAFKYQGGFYGISVLLQEKALSVLHLPLPTISPISEPRVALVVKCNSQYGLANVHLSRDPGEAQEQAKAVFQYLPGWVTILCGDFNLPLENLAFNRDEWASVFVPNREPFTWPADLPCASLDHILVRTNCWKPVRAKTMNVGATDHLAVIADLRNLLIGENNVFSV